ncbi:hypothetical protein [uncultured Sphingomonas sp.]|uniref:hypothetical protein n=1 Tax=uncultured Sphingomonas sp. TaxID=158754 RepID=UPI0035CBD543
MIDAEPSTDGSPAGDLLLAELRAINDEVEAGAREMERLSRLTALPDGAALSTARLRFSRALRRHLQHVDGAILSYLRVATAVTATPAVEDFRRLLHEYHEAAAHHVARWPSTSVVADWDGYRRSVADMLARLRERTEVEKRDIHPLLAGKRPR